MEFETLFSIACPKFLSPVAPNYDTVGVSFHKVCLILEVVSHFSHFVSKHVNISVNITKFSPFETMEEVEEMFYLMTDATH